MRLRGFCCLNRRSLLEQGSRRWGQALSAAELCAEHPQSCLQIWQDCITAAGNLARQAAGGSPSSAALQEMYEEYARAVQQVPGKAHRLRIFLFPAVEEDLTPEQYRDGNAFFSEAQENMWCAPAPAQAACLHNTVCRAVAEQGQG